MSLSISQGLQTCLEPRIVEPVVLRLKLGPSIPPINTNTVAGANEMGSWSFLLSLNNANPQHNKQDVTEKDRAYVHPLDHQSRPASRLSAESLAMCTESLGSESGGDNISILSIESSENFQPPIEFKAKKQSQSRRDVNFPPPLSSGGVRVRPRREGGRLVLEAVRVSTAETNFRAERSNGRLRLHLLADQETEDDSHETEQETGDLEREHWGRGKMGNCGNLGGKMGIENFEGARMQELERHCGGGGGGWLLKPICLS